jgi:outer membrane protein OmpA-like peptidoglycan-associated protein/WD40 repeat protein
LVFDAGVHGKTQYKPVFVKGNNMGLNTTSITNTNKLLFGIKQQEFPIKSELNELKIIEFSFTPKDSIYETTIYTVKNPGCPDAFIEAATRGERKLLITNPIKGNEFVRGTMVPISWKGIEKSTSVDFFYRIKGQNSWHEIGAGTKNQKLWKAPAINDSIKIQGRVTNNITLSNLLSNNIQLIDGEDYKAANFSPDGTQIITHSNLGQVKNWNAETGNLNHIFEKSHFGDVAFFPNYNRLVSIFDSTFSVFTNRNGLEMVSLPLADKKVYASLTHVNNKELYASLWNYSSLTQMQFNYADEEYKNGTASPQGNFAITYDKSELTIYKLLAVKKWFTIKVNTDFEKAILHNSMDFMVVVTATNTVLYNLEEKDIVKEFNSELFVQFTVSGTHFITESNAQLHVNELKTGNRVYSLPTNLDYAFSKNGKYLAYLNNDTLGLINLTTQQIEWRKPYKNPEQFQFFPESNRLVLLHKDTLTILNYKTRQEELSVYAEPNLIKMLDIAPNEKSILLTTQKIVSVWEIKNHFDTDTTPYFNIFTPQPEVDSQISFPKQYLNISTEKVFKGIIKNHTSYPVGVDSMYISSNNTGFNLVSSQGYMNIQPNEEKSVEIRFTPQKIGIHTGNLIVVVGNNEYNCKISGEGISHTFDLPSPFLHFSPILVGNELDSLIPFLINTGTESILVKDVDLKPVTDDNFRLETVKLPKSLYANDTLWANVVFNPKRRGMQNAFISLKIDDNEWIKTTNLIGTGEAKRQIILAGKTVNANTGESLKSVVTITELNSGNIIFNEKTLSNGFFAIKINTDLNYSISAQLNGFFSSSINIDLLQPQFSDTLWVNIDLIPIERNGTVKLNNIFFEFGKAELLDMSKTEIMRLIALMEAQPALKIEIQGHTDNIGSTESNMQLSKMRAIAVKNYMLEAQIDSRRITTTFYGETQALQDNNTELGRKANRRVEIKFIGL